MMQVWIGAAFVLGAGCGIGLCLVWSWARDPDRREGPDGSPDRL